MAVTLSKPIAWKAARPDDRAMLETLQPNILKPHTREFLTILFLRFLDRAEAASLLRELATDGIVPAPMKSAWKHFEEVEAFHEHKTPGTSHVGLGLTKKGYDALGIAAANQPADPSFQRGMAHNATQAALQDPDVDSWEGHFKQEVHAAILVGDQLASARDAALARVQDMITARPSIVVLAQQKGNGLHNRNGDGIEHFGYVDGRSQPLFLVEDVLAEMLKSDGTTNWDPGFGPGRAIVPDPAAPDPALQFGSYFVFRKLEQNVRAFKTKEKALAEALGLAPADEELAGAMIVGRFEDGTPLVTQSSDGNHSPVPNDFTYDSDPGGGKCPLFGHIRKMNPRGSGGFESHEEERLHIMARRGLTYGVRTDDPNDGAIMNKPEKDVGLLFMAFNASLAEQFEFVQMNWANFAGFPQLPGPNEIGGHPASSLPPGLDLIIGNGPRPNIDCPLVWGADYKVAAEHKTAPPIDETVTMRGGEYFFMPSLAFLRSLA